MNEKMSFIHSALSEIFYKPFSTRRIDVMKQAYIYILASQRNGTLYTGVTSDLIRRVWQHKTQQVDGFTAAYNVHHLVYFEQHADISTAITREKQIKRWRRAWKVRLIEQHNPNWIDLYEGLL